MGLLIGLAALAGAVVLFAAAVVLVFTEPIAVPVVVAVLAGAWWLAGKRWW